MAAMSGDFSGCSVLIYDEAGNHLGDTVVTSYDKASLRIEVQMMPYSLDAGAGCRLLILSAPIPYEFLGRVAREGAKKVIAMYKGKEKESRGSMRYKVNYPALIENLICDNRAYPLHTPLKVTLLNISKSGVRFRTPHYSMTVGDKFQMRIRISDTEKLLIADVINHVDKESISSEYGCRFLVGSEKVV